MKVMVTGASGFLGVAVVNSLHKQGCQVVQVVRRSSQCDFVLEDIGLRVDWGSALCECDVVIHLAARVHVMNETSADPLTEFRRVNVEGTMNLARQAALAGVQRFVFLSSIKVNGEFTEPGRPFAADDTPAPEDAYGVSKHEAEQALRQMAAETGMEVVIIRPPLVYGPGVKANFKSMMGWLARGLPLPLAAVTENRRSLVALDNLVDLVTVCLTHPMAANQTFLASDGEDISTADLLQRMGLALGRPARLFHVPDALLKRAATLVNKPGVYQRLCGSLQVNISQTRQLLGWQPPMSVDEALRRTAEGFRA